MRTAFAHQRHTPRRIAKWSGAVLVLLALLLIGVFEFGQEDQLGRMLDKLGISRDTTVADSAPVSAPAVGPGAPAPPPITADAASATPMPTEPTSADSPVSATAPSPPGTPIADAGVAKPVPTESPATDSSAGATANAPASPPGPDGTTLSAATTAAPAEPAPIAKPPAALTPTPKRTTQQQFARAPASPRQACGPRTQFSLYRCMKLQCSQRRWTSHAQCQRLRVTDSVD